MTKTQQQKTMPPPPKSFRCTYHQLILISSLLTAVTLSVLSCISVVNCDHGKSKLLIFPNTEKVNVDVKQGFTLKCKPSGDNPLLFQNLHWHGPNIVGNWQELEQRHKVTIGSDRSAKLYFNSSTTTINDSGNYTCEATYHSSDPLIAQIQIDFYSPIEIKDCRNIQSVVLNDEGKIICSVTSMPGSSVEILKNSVPLTQSSRYIYEDNDHIRIVGPVQESDAGKYTFVYTQDEIGATETRDVFVEVHRPPKILSSNPNNPTVAHFRGIEGQEVTLSCNATGFPQPRINWFDAKKRNVSSVGGYHVDPESGTLKIEKVSQIFDDGQFTCVANNDAGKDEAAISVAVDIRPSISLFENKTVEGGHTVELECRSNGKPEPKIEIRRYDRRPYMRGDGFFKEENLFSDGDVYVYRLTLSNVPKELDGLHYCNSSNIAGWSDKPAHLKIAFKPDLSATPPIQFYNQRTSIIYCLISAYPSPIIRWYKDNIPFVNTDSRVDSSDHKSYKATLNLLNQSVSSTYRCEATNNLGSSSKEIRVERSRVPGLIDVNREEIGPTYIKLSLVVSDDGGDEINSYEYRLSGYPAYNNSPFLFNLSSHQVQAYLQAMVNLNEAYYIKNLRPRYKYSLEIAARNSNGLGGYTTTTFLTPEPTRPNKPIINKPIFTQSTTDHFFTSPYSNGYKLVWSEPESNGNNITKYIIEYKEADKFSTTTFDLVGENHVIEQLRDRPTYANIGPLRPGVKYTIKIKALNEIGSSDTDRINIVVSQNGPKMPELSGTTLSWSLEEQYPITLWIIIVMLIFALIAIDLTFCFFCKIGATYHIREFCCPSRKHRVVRDKSFNQ